MSAPFCLVFVLLIVSDLEIAIAALRACFNLSYHLKSSSSVKSKFRARHHVVEDHSGSLCFHPEQSQGSVGEKMKQVRTH